jgi:hypothetical protein
MASYQYEWCDPTGDGEELRNHFSKHAQEFAKSKTWNRPAPKTEAEYVEMANKAIKEATLTGKIEVGPDTNKVFRLSIFIIHNYPLD